MNDLFKLKQNVRMVGDKYSRLSKTLILDFSNFLIARTNSLVRIIPYSVQIHKYGVFSGPCFPVFIPNIGKYGPGKTLYLDTFHAVHGHKFMTFWS